MAKNKIVDTKYFKEKLWTQNEGGGKNCGHKMKMWTQKSAV